MTDLAYPSDLSVLRAVSHLGHGCAMAYAGTAAVEVHDGDDVRAPSAGGGIPGDAGPPRRIAGRHIDVTGAHFRQGACLP